MCRSLPESLISHLRHGVVIKQASIDALQRIDTLTEQAQHRATQLIKSAGITTAQMHNSACEAGFQTGVLQLLPQLINFIDEYKTIIDTHFSDSLLCLQTELTAFFGDRVSRHLLIQQLTGQHAAENDCALILPVEFKKNNQDSEYIARTISIPVSFHFSQHIILRVGKKLLYLTPETFAKQKIAQIDSKELREILNKKKNEISIIFQENIKRVKHDT
ncbi:hypothetical protein [Morganella psychrotolerans]|uniref:hypothetical protein n=1 Tax=Morganella psychrotolerans TaxID=368603 RepID=UPI0039B0092D